MVGADLVFPQQFLQAAPLSRIIEETRPTLTGAVPTVLTDLLINGRAADLSSLPAGDVWRFGGAACA